MSGIKGKCAAGGLAAAVSALGVGACTPAPAKPVLLIYGDSLTVLSEPAVTILSGGKYTIVFRAYGGTAMCSWSNETAADRVHLKPSRVVLAFTGNVGGCVQADYRSSGITGVVANYDRSLRDIARNFAGVPVTVIASPAMNNLTVPGLHPQNGNPAINAMYKADSIALGLRYSTVAETPSHRATSTPPIAPPMAPRPHSCRSALPTEFT